MTKKREMDGMQKKKKYNSLKSTVIDFLAKSIFDKKQIFYDSREKLVKS